PRDPRPNPRGAPRSRRPPASGAGARLAFPLGLVFSSNGQRVYVAGFGSGKVGIFDAAALEAGTIGAGTKTLVNAGGGPSGLALDEAHDRLYVMKRVTPDNSIGSNASNPAAPGGAAVGPPPFHPPPGARPGGAA